ncbi:MAG: RlmE family RNA methyltransferase [Bdellovibrionales bacterium]|nr:RlmE family RNA methyltransferase [Bdellovibrionales bacterium]
MANYNRKDHLYKQAKADGYRSRAAFKLLELNQKYKFLTRGAKVFDLGSWPGGWIQVAKEKVGAKGLVVGIDLQELEPFSDSNVKLIHGDIRDEECLQAAKELAEGDFDVVISDMSAKLTGIKTADQAASVGLAELGLWVSQQLLKPGGVYVAKVFKGGEVEEFVKTLRPIFDKVQRTELKSTRKTSKEFYIVGIGIKQSAKF